MSLDDRTVTFPDAASNFSAREMSRWNKAVKKIQERLASTCRHLVKASDSVPRRKPFVDRRSAAYKEWLNGTEKLPHELANSTDDDIPEVVGEVLDVVDISDDD